MRRRELLTGIGSVGVLTGGAGVVLGGLPSFGDEPAAESEPDEGSEWPIEIATLDARGSEAGTIVVPNDGITVAEFFVTGCGHCQAQMPRLAEAQSRLVDDYGEDLTVVSVTYQSTDSLPDDELRTWWRTHDGNWAVARDPESSLAAHYGIIGYPVTAVIDETGEKRWEKLGVKSSDAIVQAVEAAFESFERDHGPSGTASNDSTTA
ncbi:TlpA disulfide reductase family protein [Natrinema pallidum]|uniref:TlpA family protein disulfide reductase n=1 Tax=Natrinema pallidum TaxID=69527 RepID=A0A4P9TGW2_9EURY|nr:TlpA disulfide reductase family protein [Natrinema pallidum]QCW04116.1 TlpA family protein disulfide reductase [Natrinema pallidum]